MPFFPELRFCCCTFKRINSQLDERGVVVFGHSMNGDEEALFIIDDSGMIALYDEYALIPYHGCVSFDMILSDEGEEDG